jgi:hypothetical protein
MPTKGKLLAIVGAALPVIAAAGFLYSMVTGADLKESYFKVGGGSGGGGGGGGGCGGGGGGGGGGRALLAHCGMYYWHTVVCTTGTLWSVPLAHCGMYYWRTVVCTAGTLWYVLLAHLDGTLGYPHALVATSTLGNAPSASMAATGAISARSQQ